jgi:hypothetical protein
VAERLVKHKKSSKPSSKASAPTQVNKMKKAGVHRFFFHLEEKIIKQEMGWITTRVHVMNLVREHVIF